MERDVREAGIALLMKQRLLTIDYCTAQTSDTMNTIATRLNKVGGAILMLEFEVGSDEIDKMKAEALNRVAQDHQDIRSL
jgi:hypothetical protein